MKPEDFVHLHIHSHYSLLEALPSTKAIVSRIKSQGMNAVALTDNGSMYGAVEFYQACEAEGVKPILGLDLYLAPFRMQDKRPRVDDKPFRLPVIAYNDAGHHNLLRLSTGGFLEGFYYKPRVDKPFLEKHTAGLIAFSGSMRGEIPEALSLGDTKKAKELVEYYQSIFGKDHFFLELIHRPDSGRQVDLNEELKELSKVTGCPLVVTKDAYYLDPEDKEGYEAQLCIMRGRTLEQFRQTNADDLDLSLGDVPEILEAFKDCEEALQNTRKIADMVNFTMDLGHNYLPIFPLPEGVSDNDYLYNLTIEGLKKRYGDPIPEEAMERFIFEHQTIAKMGYASYFIIVHDFVDYAKEHGVLVGPGRGSAAGSIIAYALRITDLDPLKYGLLFERFLNPDRVSMPDIDMDFADNRRGEVLDYVTKKYGADRVAGIITFGTLKPKAAVRDAARVLGLTFAEADVIAKAVPDPIQGRHTPLAIAIKDVPDLKVLYDNNPMARRTIDLAMKLEGNPRHASQHACGIVIGDRPLVERVPIQAGQREDMALVTQYSLNSAEAAGLVKMDFLGLSNLTVIQDALDIIEAVHGVKVDIEHVPLDDAKTFELLGRGDTTGVFQLESDGMKRYIRELKPTEFEDIVAMVSLYRPGPLSAGMVPQYIDRKNGREKVVYDHPLMKDILKETYGVTVYQEQIMRISRVLAGFSAGEADTLRKAMGKKKRDVLEKMFESFLAGCVKNGVPERTVRKIWTDWEGFADYAFNKSHAACYALIAYRTAFLKAHYPAEFMAALMNSDINTLDRITVEVEECERLGIKVLPPDVNESFPGFAVVKDSNNIRWGLAAIKNHGEEAARGLVAERKAHGDFLNVADFAGRLDSKSFNKKSLESLIKSGALDRFEDRSVLIANMEQILLFHKQAVKDKVQNQVSMFDLSDTISTSKLNLRHVPPLPHTELLTYEKELLGIYVSAHPTEIFTPEMKRMTVNCAEAHKKEEGSIVTMIGIVSTIKQILTKKDQKPMAFARIEDKSGSLETVIFPKTYAKYRTKIVENTFAMVTGKISVRERGEDAEHSLLIDSFVAFTDKQIQQIENMLRVGSIDDEMLREEEVKLERVNGVSIVVPERPTQELISALREVFADSPGREPVYLIVESGGKERRISTEYKVEKTQAFMAKLQEIVGADKLR